MATIMFTIILIFCFFILSANVTNALILDPKHRLGEHRLGENFGSKNQNLVPRRYSPKPEPLNNRKTFKLSEIINGRIAMISVALMVQNEVMTGRSFYEQFMENPIASCVATTLVVLPIMKVVYNKSKKL